MNCQFAFDQQTGIQTPFRFGTADQPTADQPVTRLQLGRLLLLATEVGARFQRDSIRRDAAEWMVTPRRIFAGSNAVDACRDELPFLRAMVLHGLSLGLDADPQVIDDLVETSEAEFQASSSGNGSAVSVEAGLGGKCELYTATIANDGQDYCCHVFQAMVAATHLDVRAALARRVGDTLSEEADVRRGYDPSHPIACANVSPAIAAVLEDVALDPSSSLAHGLDVFIEHRFAH